MKGGPFKYDLAYGCFTFCGLFALIMSAIEAGLPNHDIAVGLGFLILVLMIPLMLTLGGAMLTGVALSLHLWKHWPLLVLSAMSVGVVATMEMTEFGSTKLFYKSVAVVYGILVFVVSGLWFVVLRRRHFPSAVK